MADSGEWGTFAWTEHVLGAPGYRIAGGTDEIQRNILAERVSAYPGSTPGRAAKLPDADRRNATKLPAACTALAKRPARLRADLDVSVTRSSLCSAGIPV